MLNPPKMRDVFIAIHGHFYQPVLGEEGMAMGTDMGDVLIMPVASAQALFNVQSLFRVLVEANNHDALIPLQQSVIDILRERHDGEEDVTVISQDALLATFNRILGVLTYTLGGIAAISLIVAGIMIMNVILVAVAQRTAEIGLLKAHGGSRRQLLLLFLAESALLSLFGAMIGLILGFTGNWVLQQYFPDFPLKHRCGHCGRRFLWRCCRVWGEPDLNAHNPVYL